MENAKYGIHLQAGTNTLNKNLVNNNGFSGVFLDYIAGCKLTGNILSNNSDAGIVAVGAVQNALSEKSGNGDATEGIVLESGSDSNKLTGNVVQFNHVHGIELEHSSNNALTNNTAKINHQSGFSVIDGSMNNTLSGNTANANFGAGFQADFPVG